MASRRARSVLPAILILLVPAIPAGAQERTPLQPLDVFELETASDPQISPDGSRIVYVRGGADIKKDSRTSDLWIVDASGANHRPLVTGTHSAHSPRWSPRGDRLAYLSDEEGSTQIHVRWMDTGQTVRVTHVLESPGPLSWSPDGKWIAFTALVPDEPTKIGKLPTPPEGAEWAPPARVMDRLTYRFDQVGYLDPGHTQIFIVPAEGGTARPLTSGRFNHGGSTFSREAPVWAPDGQHLLFTANRHPDWRRNPLATDIFEVEVSSGELRKITGPAGPDGSPTVSPDGSLVAFLGFEDRYQGHQTTRLWVIKRDGSGLRCLSTDFDRDLSDPVFAGDGTGVHALYDHHGDTRLAFFSLDGSMRELASEVGIGGSAYSRGEFSISPGGTFAFPRTRPDTMGEIVVGTTKNDSKQPLRVVAEVNDDLFRQRKLGKVTEHWYTSSKDGRDVQAWLVHPPDFESGKQYPLILEIHGGPFANYGGRFDLEKQLWAAQGYLVLYTNPRGSTSYGEEFGNLIHHAYPGDDFFDLDSGVDMVVKSGIADPENVFVTGGSGGGVLTCWMIGRSDRFRAAATAYPVIDWTSFTLTTDIAAFVSKYWFPGLPWDHPEHYFKRSLLSVIKNVKTPTMVITGEEDWRTPISESEMYFQALQLLGVESVLVRFPGEPHGIRRRPSHHLSKIQHIVGWFDEHRTKVDLPAAVQ